MRAISTDAYDMIEMRIKQEEEKETDELR